ncbi:MAG: hypothetical protein ACE5F1_03990 [Planctomycetota bacterium]
MLPPMLARVPSDFPLAAMDKWPAIAVIVMGYFVYDLIQRKIKADRDEKIAQVEADMRLKLVKELKDPALVEKVLQTKLDAGEDGVELADKEIDKLHAMAKLDEPDPRSKSAKLRATATSQVRWGLVLFLTGAALIFAALPFTAHVRPLWIPGLILAAIGLAIITFATMQRDIHKQIGIEGVGEEEVR